MAIDSVGGTYDPNEATRQRALQEERARKLKEAAERRESEISQLNAQREAELEGLRRSTEHELEGQKIESQERLEEAKALSENRLRSFQDETQKLADEAKRQFSAKAVALQKSALELQGQREALTRQHEATMSAIAAKGRENEADLKQRLNHEVASSHIQTTQRLEEAADRAQAELERQHSEILDRKRMTEHEGDREIQAIKGDYAFNAGQIQNEIEFDKRIGQEQLIRERENLAQARQNQEIKANLALDALTKETERQLGHTHSEGRRKIIDAKDLYSRQLADSTRESRKNLRDTRAQMALSMVNLAQEAEGQQTAARQAYANQKAVLEAARTKNIDDGIKANIALEQKLEAEYEIQNKHLIANKEATLKQLIDQDTAELSARMQDDRRKINAATMASSRTLASHHERDGDPFYQLHSVQAQVEDGEQFTVVRVKVPEHEQDTIRVTLQKGALTISGTRRSASRATSEDGHQMASSSFQSYSESFPVRGKLMMNNMLRAYSDGELVFRIPKG